MDSTRNMQELSQKAEEIYKKLQPDLKDLEGKYIAIDLNTEKHFIGETREDAVSKARKTISNRLLFIRRIGDLEKISTHVCPQITSSQENNYACLF